MPGRIKGSKRATLRRAGREAKKIEAVAGQRPYKVKAVYLQVRLEFYDPATGETTGEDMSQPFPVYEANFFPGLREFLRQGGVNIPDKPTPKSEEKKEPAKGA